MDRPRRERSWPWSALCSGARGLPVPLRRHRSGSAIRHAHGRAMAARTWQVQTGAAAVTGSGCGEIVFGACSTSGAGAGSARGVGSDTAAERCGAAGTAISAGIGPSEAVCTGAVRNEMVFTSSGRIGSVEPGSSLADLTPGYGRGRRRVGAHRAGAVGDRDATRPGHGRLALLCSRHGDLSAGLQLKPA